MRLFSRRLFMLARDCGAAGLTEQSRLLFQLSRDAAGDDRNGLDYRLYQMLASVFGWRLLGRSALAMEHWVAVARSAQRNR